MRTPRQLGAPITVRGSMAPGPATDSSVPRRGPVAFRSTTGVREPFRRPGTCSGTRAVPPRSGRASPPSGKATSAGPRAGSYGRTTVTVTLSPLPRGSTLARSPPRRSRHRPGAARPRRAAPSWPPGRPRPPRHPRRPGGPRASRSRRRGRGTRRRRGRWGGGGGICDPYGMHGGRGVRGVRGVRGAGRGSPRLLRGVQLLRQPRRARTAVCSSRPCPRARDSTRDALRRAYDAGAGGNVRTGPGDGQRRTSHRRMTGIRRGRGGEGTPWNPEPSPRPMVSHSSGTCRRKLDRWTGVGRMMETPRSSRGQAGNGQRESS